VINNEPIKVEQISLYHIPTFIFESGIITLLIVCHPGNGGKNLFCGMKNRTHFQYLFIPALCLMSIISCSNEPVSTNNDNGFSALQDTTLVNVEYGSHTRQVYDIYLPANRGENTPVIMMIHGGAWKEGKKEDFNYYMNLIKSAWSDVAIVNINYRLASNADNIHHDQIISDLDDALSHVSSNGENYQISNNSCIFGASAGGQLAMIYAYKYNSDIKCVGNMFGPSVINDWSWYNSTNLFLGANISSILTEYVGQSWDEAVYESVSPYWNIDESSQPTIIFHGTLDPIVPFYQSQWMQGKLNSHGVPNALHQYFAFHSFDNAQSQDVVNKMVAFFKTHIE
jgi:acetyl esterase/lipase